jgi:hypothetical protein
MELASVQRSSDAVGPEPLPPGNVASSQYRGFAFRQSRGAACIAAGTSKSAKRLVRTLVRNLIATPATVRRQVRIRRSAPGGSKPGNSAAFSRFSATGAVRTWGATGCDAWFAPVAAQDARDPAAFSRSGANLSATGATGRFAPFRAQKARKSAGFRSSGATVGCELRTRNQGLSLAKYRAAPPRISIRQGRTQMVARIFNMWSVEPVGYAFA